MSSQTETPTIQTRHDDSAERYEALVDGQVVAIADHRDAPDGSWVFHHTFTQPQHRGRGIAEKLVADAMADVRARGLKVHATCWFVDQWLDAHADFADVRA